jgi:hypothetical protein
MNQVITIDTQQYNLKFKHHSFVKFEVEKFKFMLSQSYSHTIKDFSSLSPICQDSTALSNCMDNIAIDFYLNQEKVLDEWIITYTEQCTIYQEEYIC